MPALPSPSQNLSKKNNTHSFENTENRQVIQLKETREWIER